MQSQGLSAFAGRAKAAWATRHKRGGSFVAIALLLAVMAGCGNSAETVASEAKDLDEQSEALVIQPSGRKRVVWVVMKDQANLATVSRANLNWKDKGTAVVGALATTAKRSQAQIRTFLSQQGANVRPFWIVNTLRVEADEAVINAISQRSDVKAVLPDTVHSVPPVKRAQPRARVQAVEWGLASIRAPESWATFGTKGEGIVIANIDTGVQYDHPALVGQYRGALANGTFDHNYNWFDPSGACGAAGSAPCDNNGHGTHTMGTMVGDDGNPGDNQIGVAPGARWIAAKGCEESSCSNESLLASAEWILAPTDANGQNPRPDLRPNIVNNSWGGGGGDAWYDAVVQAWVAAGIFPAFSAGNSGPGCGTVGSPGDYTGSYAVAAYDSANAIAFFSSRGPSTFGQGKPNIAAPGVSVRSSFPGDAYEFLDGTSMASPHLAGAVALLWSAAPALVGDIAGTRALLDTTAIDVDDTSCGGEPNNNFVWGEGRLDVFAAIDAAPRGPSGFVTGVITDAETSAPIAGATVQTFVDGRARSATTDATGAYSLRLPVGSYELTARAYGYLAASTSVTVAQDETVTANLALVAAPSFSLDGTVIDERGEPVANATVRLEGSPLPVAITDADGRYSFARVAEGEYTLRAEGGRCYVGQTVAVSVHSNLTVDVTFATRYDRYGYHCEPVAFDYIPVENVLLSAGDDDAVAVNLPFGFAHYGNVYNALTVGINGAATFTGTGVTYSNGTIPANDGLDNALFPFWDDLYLDGGSVRTGTVGEAPNRKFVIEWRDVSFYADRATKVSFEIVLTENGPVTFQYNTTGTPLQAGSSATSGIEDETGTDGLLYSLNEPVLTGGTAIQYSAPIQAFIDGVVTDAIDNAPIAGAVVRALVDGAQVRATTTGATGAYRLIVAGGTYQVEASASGYETQSRAVSVATYQTVVANVALRGARAELTPATLEVVATANQARRRTLNLKNTGALPLTFTISEVDAAGEPTDYAWLSAVLSSGSVAPGTTRGLVFNVNTTGLAAGAYTATLAIDTNAGRTPRIIATITLVVTGYQQGVESGGNTAHVDTFGDTWAADKAFSAGSWGYLTRSNTVVTANNIAGTAEQRLYKSQIVNPYAYQFDRVPNGVYQVELGFAELSNAGFGKRLFDVQIEGNTVLSSLDIRLEAGTFAAKKYTFFVPVTDGRVDVRFLPRAPGTEPPVVNAIRVTHRPDR